MHVSYPDSQTNNKTIAEQRNLLFVCTDTITITKLSARTTHIVLLNTAHFHVVIQILDSVLFIRLQSTSRLYIISFFLSHCFIVNTRTIDNPRIQLHTHYTWLKCSIFLYETLQIQLITYKHEYNDVCYSVFCLQTVSVTARLTMITYESNLWQNNHSANTQYILYYISIYIGQA